MVIPAENPTTEEGIAYGRALFYEELLSRDGSQACGSCHNQAFGFSDNGKKFSTGIDGLEGNRNSMNLANPGLGLKFFWDGRSASLEAQALEPVINPIEMHETWPSVVAKLNNIESYRKMNYRAFGTYQVDSIYASRAIAQFMRSLISSNSKFDRFMKDSVMYPLTAPERNGFRLFSRDRIVDGSTVIPGGDCFHCHMDILDMTDHKFHNNGLDIYPADSGLARVTKNGYDLGKFKTPSLRNIGYTAPYMHDGRFPDLESVIDFYSEGLQHSDFIDPLMKNVSIGGVRLTAQEKADMKAFLLTLSDPDFINKAEYSDPNAPARRQRLSDDL